MGLLDWIRRRFHKPKRILHAESLQYDPSCTQILLDLPSFLHLSQKYDLEIIELPDTYAIAIPGTVYFAHKKNE